MVRDGEGGKREGGRQEGGGERGGGVVGVGRGLPRASSGAAQRERLSASEVSLLARRQSVRRARHCHSSAGSLHIVSRQ